MYVQVDIITFIYVDFVIDSPSLFPCVSSPQP